MPEFLPWVTFFVSAGVVVAAATQLARHGDRIAAESGVGGLWIGVVLVASATSLPEIVTDTTAAWIDEPDLAVGDLFGSSMANMMILALITLLYRRHQVWQRITLGHTLVAALAIVLTSLAGASISAGLGWSIGHVGLDTIGIALVYILGMRVVLRHEHLGARRRIAEEAGRAASSGDDAEEVKLQLPSWGALFAFGASAAFILAAAPFLASSASDISDITGISDAFVGVTFLAITTSLPELATVIAAVRLGSYDLAVGNLFGSNAVNMSIFLFADIAYRPGPISANVAEAQVLAALVPILLMATAMMGIIYRAERRFLIEPGAVAMVLGYIGGMWLIFQVGV